MTVISQARSFALGLLVMISPVIAGETSATSYWYGGELHPLVVTHDGVNYRLMGKQVMEMAGASGITRTYAHADRLGSVRIVTDDQGPVRQRLSYDDYGTTHIAGEGPAAAADDNMASFYRFQGQEQEVFPLARLGVEDEALSSWLDRIELYHFPWRDYAAGLTTFIETDPVPTEDSLYAALGANPVNITDETGGIRTLYYLDGRTHVLLYQVKSNRGDRLSADERRHLWNILQDVRAETPDNLPRKLASGLILWRSRYDYAFQEWRESIEEEIKRDERAENPDHVFTEEELAEIQLEAETLTRFGRPDKAVQWALEELVRYQIENDGDLEEYESRRIEWLFDHAQKIEELYAQSFPVEIMAVQSQDAADSAPQPAVTEKEQKAVPAANVEHGEKAHEPQKLHSGMEE